MSFKKLVVSGGKKYLRKERGTANENFVSGRLLYKLRRDVNIELKPGSGGKTLKVGIDRQVRLTPVAGGAIVMDMGQVQFVGMENGRKPCHHAETEENQSDAELRK